MKKQLLATTLVASVAPFMVQASQGTGEVIWNGTVESACGWEGQGDQDGVLGFSDYSQAPAKATLLNNAGNDDASLSFTSATGDLPEEDLKIKLVDSLGGEEEQNHNGAFNSVPAGELELYAKLNKSQDNYKVGDHTVTTTFTVTCN